MKSWKLLAAWFGLCALVAALLLQGCNSVNYLDPGNLKNETIDPSQTARFDQDNPWGRKTAAPPSMVPGEEVWILPTDGLASAGGGHGGRAGGALMASAVPASTIGGFPIPGSPVLAARKPNGELALVPLKHTDVDAKISGYIASVGVTQQFTNPFSEKIEAVYVFPLPENAGVSDFVMTIGDRHIRGIIRERADAERIYQLAREQGFRASMMTQERPNIFTQNVANIEPGKQIDIQITYFHTLTYADGWFEWVFPMVVGPRYNPARSTGFSLPPSGADAPVGRPSGTNAPSGQRSGHDISLKVQLDAGLAIEDIQSVNHRIRKLDGKNNSMVVELDPADSFPNKDFVLRYKAAGDQVKTALFVQKDKEGKAGWFTLLLVPPAGAESLPRRPVEMAHPVLSNVKLAFDDSGMKATDVYPRQIPELLAGRPVVITGRYTGEPTGSVTITGAAGEQKLAFAMATAGSIEENPAIATLWARAKVADLRDQAFYESRDVSAGIKATALSYGIISEFTNFIAVDSTQRTEGDHGTTVAVPVPVPEGTRYESTVQTGMNQHEN